MQEMHRRQSHDLLTWIPSRDERLLYAYVLGRNDMSETMLAITDYCTREHRTQGTEFTEATVMNSINKTVRAYVRCTDPAKRTADMTAARIVKPRHQKAAKDKRAAVKATKKQKAVDDRAKTDRLRAQQNATTARVDAVVLWPIAYLRELPLPGQHVRDVHGEISTKTKLEILKDQMRKWKQDVSIVWDAEFKTQLNDEMPHSVTAAQQEVEAYGRACSQLLGYLAVILARPEAARTAQQISAAAAAAIQRQQNEAVEAAAAAAATATARLRAASVEAARVQAEAACFTAVCI